MVIIFMLKSCNSTADVDASISGPANVPISADAPILLAAAVSNLMMALIDIYAMFSGCTVV